MESSTHFYHRASNSQERRADVLHDFHVGAHLGREFLSPAHARTHPVGTPQSQPWPGMAHHYSGNAITRINLNIGICCPPESLLDSTSQEEKSNTLH